MKSCDNAQNVTQRHEVSRSCWENGTGRRAQHRIATDFPLVKKRNICEVQ